MIRQGRVLVNGTSVTRYAEPVPPDARLEVGGQLISAELSGDRVLLLMHKPKKHLTQLADSADGEGLGKYLPKDSGRVFPVGRLDYNSEGALLFTNDGELGRRVLHPDWSLQKRYRVKIRGHLAPDEPAFDRMRAGMTIGKSVYRPVAVRFDVLRTRATWVELTLTEGKNRQIRKMCAACGFQIVKLRREAIGPVELGELKPRCVRSVTPEEANDLLALLQL